MHAPNPAFLKQSDGRRITIIGAFVNGFLALLKVVGGSISGSSALLADGIHSATDLVTDIMTYITLGIANQGPDDSHPYGHGKFETFATLVLAILLALAAAGISFQAVERLIAGDMPPLGPTALAIAALSIFANEALFWTTKKVGERINSNLLIANAWHHRTDSISSVVALAGIGLNMAGFAWFDAVAAILVAIFLLRTAWRFGKEAFDELVDAAIDEETQTLAEKAIKSVHGVKSFHFMRARTVGGEIFLDVHVEVDPYISVSEGHAIAEGVEEALLKAVPELSDAIVHIDPYSDEHSCVLMPQNRPELEQTIKKQVEKHLPEASVERIILHVLPERMEAEVIISSDEKPPKNKIDALHKALNQPDMFSKTKLYLAC